MNDGSCARVTAGNLPIELVRDGTMTIGRSTECDVVIVHPSVSRRHARLTRRGKEVWLEDLERGKGTCVNNSPIRKVRLRPEDVVRIGKGASYRFDGSSLIPQDCAFGLSVELTDVAIERDGRMLLSDVSLGIERASFVAILGPSGVGKSLLLHCLASLITPTRGAAYFDDGVPVADALDEYQAKIGLVTQEDLVFDYLTVEENLVFSARLRMPMLPRGEINRRVEDVLGRVELNGHRMKRVKVLSGGQRKRVGVAVELLLQPRLLLLDEPTSGLDPGSAAQLAQVLRGLSRQAVTVVCTTHTTETLHYFDRAVLLGLRAGAGRIAFDGTPADLMPKFGVTNAPDLFDRVQSLDGSNIEPTSEARQGATRTRRTSSRTFQLPRQTAKNWALVRQILIVARRSALGFWRDRANCQVALAQPPLLALLTVFSQHAHDEAIFIFFFLVISALWLGMTTTVREIVRERDLYVKDRMAALSPDAYLTGKLVFALALSFGQAFLLAVSAQFLVWLMMPNDSIAAKDILAASFTLMYAILIVCNFAGTVMGLAISVIATSERAAVSMLPLWILPQMLLSRVSYGDGAQPWSVTSPFAPLAHICPYLISNDATLLGRLDSLLSLPLLSRAATAILDMGIPRSGSDMATIAIENLWGLLLLMLYVLSLYVLFRRNERKWKTLR